MSHRQATSQVVPVTSAFHGRRKTDITTQMRREIFRDHGVGRTIPTHERRCEREYRPDRAMLVEKAGKNGGRRLPVFGKKVQIHGSTQVTPLARRIPLMV